MQILFLLTQDLESPSGLGRYRPMAQELVKLGHRVTIAALHPSFESLKNRRFDLNGVNVRYVAQMHVRKTGSQKTYYSPSKLIYTSTRAALALTKEALWQPADIIHIAKPHPMNSVAGAIARVLTRRRIFLDCDDYEAGVGNYANEWQRRIVSFFEDRMPFHVEKITTNTYFTRNRMENLGVAKEKIVYISNGVDRLRFAPPAFEDIKTLRKQLGLDEKIVVGFIGSLSRPSHPVDLLLHAFTRVHHAAPNSVLLLVGGGDDLDRLRSQAHNLGIGESIIFTGRVPSDRVVCYYHLMDASIDPILDDDAAKGRSPLKLFESWACGVPFISSDVGDRRYLLGDPPAGLLTLPGDPDHLAHAILDVLAHPELSHHLSSLGNTRVKGYYWDKLAVSLESAYKNQFPN